MDHQQMLDELREPTKALRRAIPETWAGFQSLHAAGMADGVVPARIKEAVAMAIGVAARCEGCIEYHARAAAKAGATPEEVAEILGVTLVMGGGPASVHAPVAWDAYQTFRREFTVDAA